MTFLNFFRLTRAGAVNGVLVALSIAALAAFVAAGLPRVSIERFSPFAPAGPRGILSAAALLFVAYAGYARIATLGEEIENSRRNIPIALVLSLAAAAGPGWVGTFLAVGAVASLGSVFLNLMLGLSRMIFAMARGGDLPGGLAKLGGSSSPFMAVVAVGGGVGALTAAGSLLGLLSMSAFAMLVYYGLTNLSVLRLGREDRLVHPAVPLLGLVFCAALSANVPPRALLAGGIVLAVGGLWRLAWKAWPRRERSRASWYSGADCPRSSAGRAPDF